MNRIITFIVLGFSIHSFSQTQAEMNQEAYVAFKKADKVLNNIYKKIISDYQHDTIFIKSLKKTQRKWIEFRDSELEMKFPEYPAPYYGSVQPMCRDYYLEELTIQRVNTLKIWLEGIKEGDMCSGSVKVN